MGELSSLLRELGARESSAYREARRVLSFDEYLAQLEVAPSRFLRDAPRYLRDCIAHWGHEGEGEARRFRLFDWPFAATEEERIRGRLVGHAPVQQSLYRWLEAFARTGRADRLLLLHGPNGSAKSTFVASLAAGLEAYSMVPEGARYTFSWVFPVGREGQGIGFGAAAGDTARGDSFAHFPEEKIDLKLASPTREHPLLLLPPGLRRPLLDELAERSGEAPPELLVHGELHRTSRAVYDALYDAYQGDLVRVLQHVRVERDYLSRRYRRGIVTIGPEMAVDAVERQITGDRSLANVPASLAAVALFEPIGELVDAAGGLIEYSDLLKRPLDAWRYLLLAIEKGEVSLKTSTLALDTVWIASSNELHLAAFRQHPEYVSFRGRLAPMRVPYLTDYRDEAAIQEAQVVPQLPMHVAPKTIALVALWAVMTRLERPRQDHYEDAALGAAAAELTPLDKAALYAGERPSSKVAKDALEALRNGLDALRAEHARGSRYEGGSGVSPRTVRDLLLSLADTEDAAGLTPPRIFDALERLIARGDHDFLKRDAEGDYHAPRAFLDSLRERWFDAVDQSLRQASGLVAPGQHEALFERYVNHVSFAMKGEQLLDEVTGQAKDPDVALMSGVESRLGVKDVEAHRRELMSGIAAFAIDHPGETFDVAEIFGAMLTALEASYYEEHRGAVAQLARDLLRLLEGAPVTDTARAQHARATRDALLGEGYVEASLAVAIGALYGARYASD